jgi:hypothetical protein
MHASHGSDFARTADDRPGVRGPIRGPDRATGPAARSGTPGLALAYLRTFRRVVVPLAASGAGVAWAAGEPWLAAAGVAVAVGELLESSYYLGVLRWGERRAGRRV